MSATVYYDDVYAKGVIPNFSGSYYVRRASGVGYLNIQPGVWCGVGQTNRALCITAVNWSFSGCTLFPCVSSGTLLAEQPVAGMVSRTRFRIAGAGIQWVYWLGTNPASPSGMQLQFNMVYDSRLSPDPANPGVQGRYALQVYDTSSNIILPQTISLPLASYGGSGNSAQPLTSEIDVAVVFRSQVPLVSNTWNVEVWIRSTWEGNLNTDDWLLVCITQCSWSGSSISPFIVFTDPNIGALQIGNVELLDWVWSSNDALHDPGQLSRCTGVTLPTTLYTSVSYNVPALSSVGGVVSTPTGPAILVTEGLAEIAPDSNMVLIRPSSSTSMAAWGQQYDGTGNYASLFAPKSIAGIVLKYTGGGSPTYSVVTAANTTRTLTLTDSTSHTILTYASGTSMTGASPYGFMPGGVTGSIPYSGSITLSSPSVTTAYTYNGTTIQFASIGSTPSGTWKITGTQVLASGTVSTSTATSLTPSGTYTGTIPSSGTIYLSSPATSVAFTWNGTSFSFSSVGSSPTGTWTVASNYLTQTLRLADILAGIQSLSGWSTSALASGITGNEMAYSLAEVDTPLPVVSGGTNLYYTQIAGGGSITSNNQGTLLVIAARAYAIDGNAEWVYAQVFKTSLDGGSTWSAESTITGMGTTYIEIVCGFYSSYWGKWIFACDNSGGILTCSTLSPTSSSTWVLNQPANIAAIIEPRIVELPDHTLMIVSRNNYIEAGYTISTNGGTSWGFASGNVTASGSVGLTLISGAITSVTTSNGLVSQFIPTSIVSGVLSSIPATGIITFQNNPTYSAPYTWDGTTFSIANYNDNDLNIPNTWTWAIAGFAPNSTTGTIPTSGNITFTASTGATNVSYQWDGSYFTFGFQTNSSAVTASGTWSVGIANLDGSYSGGIQARSYIPSYSSPLCTWFAYGYLWMLAPDEEWTSQNQTTLSGIEGTAYEGSQNRSNMIFYRSTITPTATTLASGLIMQPWKRAALTGRVNWGTGQNGTYAFACVFGRGLGVAFGRDMTRFFWDPDFFDQDYIPNLTASIQQVMSTAELQTQLVGGTFYGQFTTYSAAGASVNADYIPILTIFRNGSVDSTMVVKVTCEGNGLYIFSVTASSSAWNVNDYIAVVANTSVSGTVLYKAVGAFTVVTGSVNALMVGIGNTPFTKNTAYEAATFELAFNQTPTNLPTVNTTQVAGVTQNTNAVNADLVTAIHRLTIMSGIVWAYQITDSVANRFGGKYYLSDGFQTGSGFSTLDTTYPVFYGGSNGNSFIWWDSSYWIVSTQNGKTDPYFSYFPPDDNEIPMLGTESWTANGDATGRITGQWCIQNNPAAALTSAAGSLIPSVSQLNNIPSEVWVNATRTLTSANGITAVISNPVASGSMTLYAGDTYDSTTNQLINFYDPGTWPQMTSGGTQPSNVEVLCTIAAATTPSSAAIPPIVCTVTGSSPNQVLNVPMSYLQTGALTPGTAYVFDIRASMDHPGNTQIRELNKGTVTVNAPITVFTPGVTGKEPSKKVTKPEVISGAPKGEVIQR